MLGCVSDGSTGRLRREITWERDLFGCLNGVGGVRNGSFG